MRNIICNLFGHKPPIYAKPGWYMPGEQHGTIRVDHIDNTGRIHGKIFADCPRCGAEYMMAYTHVPKVEVPNNEQS